MGLAVTLRSLLVSYVVMVAVAAGLSGFASVLLTRYRLETTRGYTRPSAEDRTRAIDLLLVDR